MPNTLVTTTWVVNESAERYMNSVKGVASFNRTYDAQFRGRGGKVGSTVLARLPQRFIVRSGQAWSPQALYNETKPVTLSYQTGVDFEWSSAQETTELDRVRENYINPAADILASDADARGMADVYYHAWNAVGTLGTTPSANLTYLQAVVKIADAAGDIRNLRAVLDPMAQAMLVNANLNSFNPAQTISEFWRTGMFGRGNLGISEWYMDQNVPRHTSGSFTASTPVVNGANQTGSTLACNGWASGATTLNKGDKFTIAGVYSVNRLSRVSTGRLQDFVVTAQTSDSTGAMAALPISPSIITSGALQTVSNSPSNGAAITVWSANPSGGTLAATTSPQSLLFGRDFAIFAMADLATPTAGATASFARSADYNISIRFIQQYDVKDDQNGNRLDILHGASPLEEWQGVRIVG